MLGARTPTASAPQTEASRLGIQDGADAGQTVPHVHVTREHVRVFSESEGTKGVGRPGKGGEGT